MEGAGEAVARPSCRAAVDGAVHANLTVGDSARAEVAAEGQGFSGGLNGRVGVVVVELEDGGRLKVRRAIPYPASFRLQPPRQARCPGWRPVADLLSNAKARLGIPTTSPGSARIREAGQRVREDPSGWRSSRH